MNIFEHYDIRCNILIDSHKGLGDWFEKVPLYELMTNTRKKELLPRYYFKGVYIGLCAPAGFKLVYTIPEEIHSSRIIADCEKEMYLTGWKK